MSIIVRAAVIFLILAASSLSEDTYKATIDSLNGYSLDDVAEIEINNVDFELKGATISLSYGKMYFAGYRDDHPTIAFFLGEGRFLFRSDDPIERQQINRFYRADSADIEFEQMYMVFPANSNLLSQLTNKGIGISTSSRVRTLWKKIRSVPDKNFKYNLGFHLYRAIVENHPDFLWVDILKEQYEHTIYYYDPYSAEPITLYKYTSNFRDPQLVSSTKDSLSAGDGDFPLGYNNFRYDIDIDISTTGKSQITCGIYCRVETDSLKQLVFAVPPDYKIDTVWGDAVVFIKDNDRSELMLDLNRFYYRGDTVKVTVQYRTNLFRHYIQHGIVQSDLTHWYPSAGFRTLSDYNLRFTIDPGFDFLCVGDKVRDTVIDNRQILEYKTSSPSAYVSFNYGDFDSVLINDTRVPITIWYYSGVNKSLVFGNPALDKVVKDVSAAFTFYDNNFGPYPYDRLDVDAMAVGFGQGSPGLVHLSEATFQRSEKGLDDKFRAHEIAHQWWGHLVSPESYRDVWLSEGLAEYSAALYVLLGRKDESTFHEILKDWRKAIIQSGVMNGKKSVGYKAGSINLGNRLGSEVSPGDYTAIIYYKAAYMLHMLRFELEQGTDNSGKFMTMLAEFAGQHEYRKASTENFIEVASHYLGDRTQPFFNQWLYDWRVPEIKTKARINKDGTAEIDIAVNDIDDAFETLYPVRFVMGDGSSDSVVYTIRSGENHFVYKAGNGAAV
ncbi:MAG: M1 family aminopeptidase, partial [Candidatus Zixiibacteriota bacterium]